MKTTIPVMDSANASLRRINRVLGMKSQISRAIVRAKVPDALYLEICRISVDEGLFQFSCMRLIDPDTRELKTMTSWGTPPDSSWYVETAKKLDDQVRLSGELCIASDLRTGIPEQSKEHDGVTAHGRQSVIALPLRDAGPLAGVFLLYVDQSEFFDEMVIRLLTETAEDISFALANMEIDQRRSVAEAKLHYLAFYDTQTGLPNRTMLEECLVNLAKQAQESGCLLSLINIKLQRMGQVLQLLGNTGTDELLRNLTLRLEHCREADTFVAQLAQDEFALATLEIGDSGETLAFARKVQAIFEQAIRCDEKDIFVQANIGCAVYPVHEPDVRYLLRRARAAADRLDGEMGVRLYSADIDSGLEQRVQMAADLHWALERNEFLLYYQPQLNIKTGEMVGVEALLRWRHPKNGIISPTIFIPLLEESGLMPSVGTWVLRTACKQARKWQDQGYKSLRVAVNLSAQQFRMADLVATVRGAIEDANLEPECLELELTESLILESVERTIQTMFELKKLGVSLSLDDFGTGYSSLSYLRHYPVDRIKIDQSFVRDMTEHAGSAALVRGILAMVGNLGLTAIAEGVETIGQYGYLRKQLCQEMQGYLFSHPLPTQELTQILQAGKKFEPGDGQPLVSYTALLVDDEPYVLAAMRRAFRHESWNLLTASNASEGFELLARHNVGVIISDQRMIGVSGTEFLHMAKEMYPDTIRILLTGYADFTTVIDAVNRGDLYKVLCKPIEDSLLRDNIREAFRRYEIFAENVRLVRRLSALEEQHSHAQLHRADGVQ